MKKTVLNLARGVIIQFQRTLSLTDCVMFHVWMQILILTIFANPPSTFDSGVRKLNVCCKEAIVSFL